MNIEHICGNTGYIDTGYSLITVYRCSENEVILLDTGNEHAEDMINLFDSLDISVAAIICTHLHYDHTANNNDLYDRFKPKIFLPNGDFEYLKMRTDYHYPFSIIDPSQPLIVDNARFEIIPSPGHSPDHLAFVTPDNVCCIGDALISQPLLSESKLPYIEDVDRAILTMEKIREMKYPYFAVSHKGVILQNDMSALIDENIKKEIELYDIIRNQITAPTLIEDAVINFMRLRGISENRIQQSYSMKNTVKSRILTLAEAGEFTIDGDVVRPLNR